MRVPLRTGARASTVLTAVTALLGAATLAGCSDGGDREVRDDGVVATSVIRTEETTGAASTSESATTGSEATDSMTDGASTAGTTETEEPTTSDSALGYDLGTRLGRIDHRDPGAGLPEAVTFDKENLSDHGLMSFRGSIGRDNQSSFLEFTGGEFLHLSWGAWVDNSILAVSCSMKIVFRESDGSYRESSRNSKSFDDDCRSTGTRLPLPKVSEDRDVTMILILERPGSAGNLSIEQPIRIVASQ